MAAINAWNAASYQTPSRKQTHITSAPMSINLQKASCIPPCRLPQNTKSQPAIVKRNTTTNGVCVRMKLNKTDEKVVATLQAEAKELSLQELTDKTGEPSKKVFKSLKKLFENEIVSTQARKYKLIIIDTKAIKAKLAAKGEESSEDA
jgi:hypothetical protein